MRATMQMALGCVVCLIILGVKIFSYWKTTALGSRGVDTVGKVTGAWTNKKHSEVPTSIDLKYTVDGRSFESRYEVPEERLRRQKMDSC
jgi:hypothetical protein